jgi:hypothetical protein
MAMHGTNQFVLVAMVVTALSACDRPKSAAQVSRDTAVAQRDAADSAAKVQQKADARIASAQADVRDDKRDLAHVDAVEGQKVADTQSAGEYKIAIARCEGLSEATQRSCKDQAEADFDVAKARAKQARVNADPKQ